MQCVIKEVVYFFGACEVSTVFASMQLFCEAEGVGYKFHLLSSSLPSSSPVPFCSSQGQELLPNDVVVFNKRWLLILFCSLVMLFENVELLSQLMNSLFSGSRCMEF